MADPAAKSKLNPPLTNAEKPTKHKRGRWLRRGILFGAVAGLLIWFAPIIVAKTALRHQLPKLLFPTYPGDIQFADLSLLWTAPVVINDITIGDDGGQPLLFAKQFSTGEPLWKLIARPRELGTLKLVDPVLHVRIGDRDSNLERVIRKYSENSTGASADVVVEIDNGKIEFDDQASNHQTAIESLSLQLVSKRGMIEELDLTIGHPPAKEDEQTTSVNWLAARYGWRAVEDEASATRKTKGVELRASRWKLAPLAPLLARIDPNSDLSGELNADAVFAFTMTDLGLEWDWSGTTGIDRLVFSCEQLLNRDKLALETVRLSGRAVATLGRVAIHELTLKTDVGELAATGDIPLDVHRQKSLVEIMQSLLSDEDYHLNGRVDLKKLSALLPQTLRIRNDAEITAGEVTLQLVGVNADGTRRWSGVAGVTGLSAIHRGQTMSWDIPVQARVNAHREGQAIVVDLVDCKSDFLQISGKGTLDDARFAATGDLSKLLENLERFVDLGIDQLSGQMQANGELRRQSDDRVGLNSKVVLNNFAYVVSQQDVWREPHLELNVVASGRINATPALTKIESAEVHLQSAGDSLALVLKQPVDLQVSSPSYASSIAVKGNLTTWQNRLRPVCTFDPWRLAGSIDLRTVLTMSPETVEISELKLGLQKLAMVGPAWLIQDPEVMIAGAGQWNRNSQTWVSPKLSATGQAMTLDLTDFEFGLRPANGWRLSGQAKYRADLAKLSAWKNQAIPNPTTYLIGTLTGTVSLGRQDNLLHGELDAQVEKFIVAGPGVGPNGQPQWVALWKEPILQLVGNGAYDEQRDQLSFETSRFGVESLSMAAKGRLDGCSTNQRIDVTGELAYDWDRLSKRFSPQVAEQVKLTGQDRRPFSLKGPLADFSARAAGSSSIPAATVSFPSGVKTVGAADGDNDLSGQFGFGWNSANVYGFTSGPAEVAAQCEHGICRFAPLDLVVNDGKLRIAPSISLGQNPIVLTIAPGNVIDQISLSPELCHSALKYAAPILADTTQVDGKLSLDAQSVALPLFSPGTGTAEGVLTIHRAQSRPGPLALQITTGIEQLKSILTRKGPADLNRDQVWIEMTEQQVPIKLEQGRVHHRGMTFMVRNVLIRTRGSVGLDNSLDLVAEIPVRDEWLGNNKLLAGLKGKTLQIPIGGTTSRPQIDPAFFANFAQQIGGSALEGLIEDKIGGGDLDKVINNGLDKLLRGKK